MKHLITALIVLILVYLPLAGIYYYVPIGNLSNNNDNLGATLTTITGSTLLSDLDTILTTNFNALNNNKTEMSSTTIDAVTTLSNLTTTGTIGTGVWQATDVDVPYGGTGGSSFAEFEIMMGSSTNPLQTLGDTGSSGEVLTSNGAFLLPSWQSITTDQSGNFAWTGIHEFFSAASASTTIESLDVGRLTVSTSTQMEGDLRITAGGLGIGSATTTNGDFVATGHALVDTLEVTGTTTNVIAHGWEIVSNTGAGPTAADGYAAAAVDCTQNRIVVGGGAENSVQSELGLSESIPIDSNTWQARYWCDPSGGGCDANTITVYAICVNP